MKVKLFSASLLLISFLGFGLAIGQDEPTTRIYVNPTFDLSLEVPSYVRAGVVFQDHDAQGVWESRIQLQGLGADEITIETFRSNTNLLTWILKTYPYLEKLEARAVVFGQDAVPGYRFNYAPSNQSYGMEMAFVQQDGKIYFFQYAFAPELTLSETFDHLLSSLVFSDTAGAEVIPAGALEAIVYERVNSCGGSSHVNNCSTATNPFPCCTNGTSSCTGNCTWWAWEKACGNWGVNIPPRGNANTWASSFQTPGTTNRLRPPQVGSAYAPQVPSAMSPMSPASAAAMSRSPNRTASRPAAHPLTGAAGPAPRPMLRAISTVVIGRIDPRQPAQERVTLLVTWT